MYSAFSKLIIAVLGLIFAFLIGELILRNVGTQVTGDKGANCTRYDHYLVHTFIPNSQCQLKSNEWNVTYRINAQGLRDIEHSIQKSPGTFRILILGDSFIEGVGVEIENAMGRIIERKLNENFSREIEVIQVGTAGWSPLNQLLFLGRFGLNYSPDLVIVTVNATDFRDEIFHYSHLTPEASNLIFSDNLTNIFNNDDLKVFNIESQGNPQYSENATQSLKIKIFLTKTFFTFRNLQELKELFQRRYDKSIANNMLAITNLKQPSDYYDAFHLPTKSIKSIKKLLDDNHINILLVTFPHGHTVSPNQWSKGRLEYGFEIGMIYSNRALVDLISWSQQERIDSFDLTPLFVSKTNDTKLYFDFDGHWNSRGHQVAADGVYQFLTESYFKSQNTL